MATPSLVGETQFKKRVGATLSKIQQEEFARGGVPVGPQSQQALLEGALEVDRREAAERASQQRLAIAEEKRLQESKRQFDIQVHESKRQAEEGKDFLGGLT